MKNDRNILIVEGKDDLHVVCNLCKCRNVKENFFVQDYDSIENAVKMFDLSINEQSTKYDYVGLVVDADTNIQGRWESIKEKVSKSNKYKDIPNELPPKGLVLNPSENYSPKIGVWIMPNNNTKGMIEDFVANLVDDKDELMEEAEQVLNSLEKRNIQRYKTVHRAKAKIHSFLAWQDEPGKPMGQAITAKILNPNSDKANDFINWLEELYQ